MTAQYLLRFEDLCPTMNWRNWERLEKLLLKRGINPILAVVPDNRDSDLQISEPNLRFWDRVREWQTRNWTIGVHGWQHVFVTSDSGVVGVTKRSEFAGLPRSVQEKKLRSALEVFERERIQSPLWIAPAHSFDLVTLKLLRELGFRYVSDGFSIYPRVDQFGLTWLPQQLWNFRRRPFGVWTISIHFNSWTDADITAFDRSTERYSDVISSFEAVVSRYCATSSTFWQSAASGAYRYAAKIKISLDSFEVDQQPSKVSSFAPLGSETLSKEIESQN